MNRLEAQFFELRNKVRSGCSPSLTKCEIFVERTSKLRGTNDSCDGLRRLPSLRIIGNTNLCHYSASQDHARREPGDLNSRCSTIMSDTRLENMLPYMSIIDCPKRNLGMIQSRRSARSFTNKKIKGSLVLQVRKHSPRETSNQLHGTWEEPCGTDD